MKKDVELQRGVLEELDWEPSIDASQIGVISHEGVVTLTGHVPTFSERHAAEETTRRVRGVKGVANEIEVRPADSHLRDDEHIAAAAVHALEWAAKVPPNRVQVVVRNGQISLEGTVDYRHERAAAERAIRHLIGVRSVINKIQLGPAPEKVSRRRSSDETKAYLEAALCRSGLVNERQISVEVDEQKVILTGDVHSQAERDEVERIAAVAREVFDVENCITITPWGQGPMEEWGY